MIDYFYTFLKFITPRYSLEFNFIKSPNFECYPFLPQIAVESLPHWDAIFFLNWQSDQRSSCQVLEKNSVATDNLQRIAGLGPLNKIKKNIVRVKHFLNLFV